MLLCPSVLPLVGGAREVVHNSDSKRQAGCSKLSLFQEGESLIYDTLHLPKEREEAATSAPCRLFVVAGDWFRSSCLRARQMLLESRGRPKETHFGEVNMPRAQIADLVQFRLG